MGIYNVINACAHLQNCSRARVGLTSLPSTKGNLFFALALHRAGLVSSVTRAGPKPPSPEQLLTFDAEPVTTANVANRRLWLGLKYTADGGHPLMWRVSSVSTPKRPVNMTVAGLHRVARGFDQDYVKGLKAGESLFVAGDAGVLEIWEALERNTGGMVLARTAPY